MNLRHKGRRGGPKDENFTVEADYASRFSDSSSRPLPALTSSPLFWGPLLLRIFFMFPWGVNNLWALEADTSPPGCRRLPCCRYWMTRRHRTLLFDRKSWVDEWTTLSASRLSVIRCSPQVFVCFKMSNRLRQKSSTVKPKNIIFIQM